MHELTFNEAAMETVTLTFDGHVFEAFALRTGSVARFHVSMLHVRVGEPDRKGRRRILVSPSPERIGGLTLTVPSEAWAEAERFFSTVQGGIGD